ncbi:MULTISPECIES: hypothetical protein [Pseudomonas]|uniref:hypothetical protein n=1 Tax=Pseudomonas TaxID=286 RepID=UPI000703A908|nr:MULTISPECIES: hypothetical protein [Pseudomonas]KQM52166.1 integrase [Pseudomonas sp. Leaf15]MBA2930418.1 integrase [Pseudomonas sivasensis]MDO4235034.1 integrase [Pseudomonas sp.]RAH04268.1 integrase [Pseudomonas sp. Leaf98]CRM47875.1 hypothetical protein [Pseudomonas sp. 28 E 9]
MSEKVSEDLPWPPLKDQPSDVRGLSNSERDKLIITATQVDGQWIIRSRYGDDVWHLEGFPSNVRASSRRLNFSSMPPAFRAVMKAILYRYIRRGRLEAGRPRGNTIRDLANNMQPFLRHLEKLDIANLGAVTPLIAATYVTACKAYRQIKKSEKPLTLNALNSRYDAVEAIYELSQYTDDQMPGHPWQGTSAKAMAGQLGIASSGRTPLMSDEIFCTIFERAYRQVEDGRLLLNLRDDLDVIAVESRGRLAGGIYKAKNKHLKAKGWDGGVRTLNTALMSLRTSCYIVLASTSGCRNHELANLQSNAHHRTEDDEGTIYHWMRSKSEKTDEGIHDWMIPEIAVRALRIMERWAAPYQAKIAAEIIQRRRTNPHDPLIAEAQKHRHSLFLTTTAFEGIGSRTLSGSSWDDYLKSFSHDCKLSWNLTSHQFRRKFANYAAHSRFGDLRYLKEHFAHWSLDMTLGYAMDDGWGQHLDLDLYMEIQDELEDIKLGVVDNWMGDESLAGGYGRSIKGWQRDPQNLLIFKDRASMLKSVSESTAIRSNGHAWCTADNDGCVGNTLERTRCTGCDQSVIGSIHAPIYQRLYDDLKELLLCKDIGEGGRLRVKRDLNRCREVLVQLDMPPEDLSA